MPKYIFQLRRGTKITNSNGVVVQDDWAQYTKDKPIEAIPREGELVLEYDNGVPRLKIGNGRDPFSALPYMSVDSFILPTHASITIYGSEDVENAHKNQWEDDIDENGNSRYKQLVNVNNATVTINSKVDLQPTPEMLAIFQEKDATFVAENEDGIVTVFCIGQKPANTYTIPVTITEIVTNND